MILGVIVACEVALWVAIVVGLAVRYLAHRPRLGLAILASVPLIDVVLLVAVAVHLRSGGTASTEHAVAAFYLGFSLAYGHRMVAWADARFAHRFAGGPEPEKLTGVAHTRRCWGDVLRTGCACLLAAAFSAGFVWWIGDPSRTAALETNYGWAVLILGIETIAAVSYTLWPKAGVGSESQTARLSDVQGDAVDQQGHLDAVGQTQLGKDA